jgi:rsbT co-antagonist protein RsbR
MRSNGLAQIVETSENEILNEWLGKLKEAGAMSAGRMSAQDLTTQCQQFLKAFKTALPSGADVKSDAYGEIRAMLEQISRSRALQGYSPSETATFIFSLKEPLFNRLNAVYGRDGSQISRGVSEVTTIVDKLGLFTFETFVKAREEVINRQSREIAELSTPVVKLWDGILALPLIGTLDSARTQVVMETLLETTVQQSAQVAIIDITGVPTVDTLVAQHLLKTVAAMRLMGADCIISGIRPQIAQTMVHLGVELNVDSKATLADAFKLALIKRQAAAPPYRKAVWPTLQPPRFRGDVEWSAYQF